MTETRKPIRINVIGTSGAGKSTYAKELAAKLKIPYIEMDQLFWEPNWKQAPTEKFLAELGQALQQESWVLDGNYGRSNSLKWSRVDTIIWLDYSLARILVQIITRTVFRAFTQQEFWPNTGNRESFWRSFFTKDSVIWWSLTTFYKNRRTFGVLMKSSEYAHHRLLRFKHPGEAKSFLKSL